MIGQWIEQSERERRILKSKIYKEMLDHQVLLNLKYKKEQEEMQVRLQLTPRKVAAQVQNKLRWRKENGFSMKRGSGGSPQHQEVQLPSLEDRNLLYRGSSRYLKLDQSSRLKAVHHRIRTQQISGQPEEQDDATIQKLIDELKNINKGMSRHRYRRKQKQASFIGQYRNRPMQTANPNDLGTKTQPFESVGLFQSNKSDLNPEARKGRRAVKKLQKEDNLKADLNINERKQTRETDKQSNNEKKPIRQERRRLIPSPIDRLSANPVSHQAQPIVSERSAQSTHQVSQEELDKRRENFLQVLRKVKTRGETLLLKLSKQSTDPSPERAE